MSKSITPEIKELSEKIAKGVSVKDGKIEIDANTYVQTLPENLSVEQVKAVADHNSNFFPAATLAVGHAAIEAMKKDKKLDSLSAEVPLIGKDHFDLTIERSRTFPNPQGGEASTTWGNVKASLVTQSARASRGVMNNVRDELSAEALKAFGK